MLFKIQQVLLHAARLVPADETTNRIHTQQRRSVKDTQHKLTFLFPNRRILVQHIVKVGEVWEADSMFRHCVQNTRSSGCSERLPEVEGIRYRVEHGFLCNITFVRDNGGRQLSVV